MCRTYFCLPLSGSSKPVDLGLLRNLSWQISFIGRLKSQHLSFLKIIPFLLLFRYIDNDTGRVMCDIISQESYGTQFEAIQHCFRIIGFTDEVSPKFLG